uniref:Uncharacterized protein n=1 Tax=Arundo donax TaxID=35708 RepID=A0A0A8ZU50_ARUDO
MVVQALILTNPEIMLDLPH